MQPAKSTALLVLGLGNLLCGDDGVGPVAVQWLLSEYAVPDGVSVLDGGTLGLSLLPYIEDAEQVLLVDAIRADQPPGSLVRLDGDDVATAVVARLSVHQVGVADVLDAARWRDRYPARLTLLGLVPQTLELGMERSPAVAAQLPVLIDRIVAEAHDLGYDFHPKASDDTNSSRSACNVARVGGLS
jgi:hydrogenase maturation protease